MTGGMRLGTLTALTAVAAAGLCADAAAVDGRINAAEREVVRLVNAQRREHGLRPVRISWALCRAAERHSLDMRRRQYFAHTSSGGVSFASRIDAGGYRRRGSSIWRVGEVIGWGSGPRRTPAAVVLRWMRSRAHRAVLLARAWRHIGVGRATGSFRGARRAAVYTVDFGLRR